MSWFSRKKKPLEKIQIKRIPEGLWNKCNRCKEMLYRVEFERNLKVCNHCNFHHRMTAYERVSLLTDPASFQERDADLAPTDPLGFKDLKRYRERLKEGQKKTGLKDGFVCGSGRMDGLPVQIGVFDFDFMGGSMGSVVGEKVTRTIERSARNGEPLVIVSCSGGARMQEGIYSLMQMAKTSAALAELNEARVPYVSVLADPVTGGVTASFAMLGDVILSEPGALIGFAGPRVIAQTIRSELPEGFQTAEFLLEHGFIDAVVDRKDLKKKITQLLRFMSPEPALAGIPTFSRAPSGGNGNP
jgi:acetyl-CoA carboxylase carboxyl transferase subunit beta